MKESSILQNIVFQQFFSQSLRFLDKDNIFGKSQHITITIVQPKIKYSFINVGALKIH